MIVRHVWKQPFLEYGFWWWYNNDIGDWFIGNAPYLGVPKWAYKP